MVTYRLATQDDYENINAFHNRIYQSNRTMEQFIWEFHNGPFGKSIYVIAENDGNVIGTNCVIPIDLITADNKIIRSGKSEDTLVDPAFRGQKIFYKIYDFLFEKSKEANIQVIWGFTSAKKPFKKMGFEIPFDQQQSLAVNHVRKSYEYLSSLNPKNKMVDRVKIAGLCIMAKVKTLGKFRQQKLTLRIEKEDKIVEGVADLIFQNQLKANNSFAIHQTPNFQEWRVYDNPNYFKTHTYGVYKDEKRVGVMVFNSHQNNVAYLCQSTFHPDLTTTEKERAIRSITGMLFNEGITLIRTWSFNTNAVNREEIADFKNAGYTHLERGIGFVWKEMDDIDLDAENFILSRIATQGVI